MRPNPFSSFGASAFAGAQRPEGGRSQVRGQASPPLVGWTIGALLERTASLHAERDAFVFLEHGVRWSWGRFAQEVQRLAAGLSSLGIGRGDRVGIWSPNRPEWVLVQFATAHIGAVLVNINPAYRVAELEYALHKVGVKALFTATGLKSSDYLGMLETLAPELAHSAPGRLQAARLPALRSIVQFGARPRAGMFGFNEVLEMGGPARFRFVAQLGTTLSAHDPINIQFTSGTTGQPKGALLTHHNVVNNARFVAEAMRLGVDDRLCVPVPLYHCFGMVLAVLACCSVGSCLVFPGESFDPAATLAAAANERCTALHGVPTMFVAMLALPTFAQFDLRRLRTGIMAGAPCPIETMKRVISDMHMHEVTIAYGMTETSPVSFQSAITDSLAQRVATVGRIQPHLEAKVVDEDGEAVAPGRTGELWVRGYSVMRGYWEDEARTREAVVDGWMRTGDLATLDADGYCNIVGRLKDMLIRGGENIYPREIEEFLYRHPSVAEAQVFGVPDPRYGEEICAWIVPRQGTRPDEEAIRSFCRGQIAHYKVPRYIRFVEALPMTVTGKAQKFAMRQEMARELRLHEARTA
ncbi:AMP-binding protein [Variovorax boronicumulans]|uniref:AMP-binding protein n=1 Tax=Variovorax boronicumulans TaxID=436515 RepID=UPI0035A8BD5F